jgi:hypothetical protein
MLAAADLAGPPYWERYRKPARNVLGIAGSRGGKQAIAGASFLNGPGARLPPSVGDGLGGIVMARDDDPKQRP